jgi:hypothetical protein
MLKLFERVYVAIYMSRWDITTKLVPIRPARDKLQIACLSSLAPCFIHLHEIQLERHVKPNPTDPTGEIQVRLVGYNLSDITVTASNGDRSPALYANYFDTPDPCQQWHSTISSLIDSSSLQQRLKLDEMLALFITTVRVW